MEARGVQVLVEDEKLSSSLDVLQRVPSRLLQREAVLKLLLMAIKELSLAKNIDSVMQVVRLAARELTGADGATFVLRERGMCYYAEENAIGPLWKGMRFPLEACVSGWAMLNKKPAIIPDIYTDERVPQTAYRPTFVKSLVVVPIRTSSPVGAIGNYWAKTREPTLDEIELLQILADSTSIAIENIEVYAELEKRVEERTRQLEKANRELEAFSYSISHDLRSPLSNIAGIGQILSDNYMSNVNEKGKKFLDLLLRDTKQMQALVDAILNLSRVSRAKLNIQSDVDLTAMAEKLLDECKRKDPDRNVQIKVAPSLVVAADKVLMVSVIQNLIGNAWKYSSKKKEAHIEFGKMSKGDEDVYFVKDNGAGFDASMGDKLFCPFQRLHDSKDFEGTGVGLSVVANIIEKHGGRIWAESQPEMGATFFFTLGTSNQTKCG